MTSFHTQKKTQYYHKTMKMESRIFIYIYNKELTVNSNNEKNIMN